MTSTRSIAAPGNLALVRRALGIIVIVFASAVMAAWLVRSEVLSAAVSVVGTMVFNTALCLALLSGGILMMDCARAWSRWTIFVLGAVVVVLAGLTLAEHLTRLNLGVDLPDMHRWLQGRAVAPGRMATGTSLALFLLGIALCLWPLAARWRMGLIIQVLAICAMVIAVFGIIIREMQLQYLYSPYVLSGMALHTAFGIIAVGAGFWLAWHPAPWNRLLPLRSDEQRIKSSATAILLGIAISAGFFGLYASHQAMRKTLIDSHMEILRSRAHTVEIVIEHRMTRAATITANYDLQQRLSQASSNPDDALVKQQLAAIAASWQPFGFSGAVFYDTTGREVARAGAFVEQTAHFLPLGENQRSRLSWNNGFHMRSAIDIFHDSVLAGRVVVEQFLPHLTQALLDMQNFGASGDLELCGWAQGRASCFPTRLNSKPYVYPPATTYQPYPVYRALGGETGNEFGLDYSGAQVFAVYAPISDYGLGMVIKVGVSELIAPLRRQLESVLPVVLLLVVMGIVLLHYVVHPLAVRMARSEQQLKLALDNSSLALWDWDISSNTVYLSEQWQEIMGGKPAVTTTTFKALQKLVHPDDAAALAKTLRDTLKDGAAYDVEHRVRTHAGEWKWIHSVGNVVERDARGQVLRMSGTNADIAARKRAEEKLAHLAHHDGLTGLPNRSLFHERLARAMARARRDKTLTAILYLDIDKFKIINDTMGHATGDALLKEFAQRLATCVRSVDTVARVGGDEFALVLEQLDERDSGCRVAEKIVAAMRPEFTLETRTLAITTSVGVAFHQGGEEISADNLLKKADQALYAAKGAGRNNYQVAD